MSNNDDNTSETASRRLIREAKEEAWHARRNLRRELPAPSNEAKRQLAQALGDYRDLLLDYQEEDALKPPWDERPVDVDVVDDLLTQTTMADETLNRRGNPRKEVPVQLASAVEPEFLVEIGKELDAIAKELGVAMNVDESMHRTEIDDKLIKEVEQWRKQNLEA